MTRAPVTLFSVKGTRLTNPEGDANFTSLRDGVDASLEKVAQANIPTTDQGPIYVPGQGPMEWNAIAGMYVAMSGGAKGGGADKVFYSNDPVMHSDMILTADQNWSTTGPLKLEGKLTVEGRLVIL